MSEVAYRVPTSDDLRAVADNMRHDDVMEVRALGKENMRAALFESERASVWSATVVWRQHPVGIVGVCETGTLISPVGVPWLLGTDGLYDMGRLFWTEAKRVVYAMSKDYISLVNYVWAGSETSVRFLSKLGFTIHAPVNVPPLGEPFHQFEMRR